MTGPRYNVCLVVDSFARGGTEHQFAQIVPRLDRRRYSPVVACLHRAGEFYQQVCAARLDTTEFPLRGWFSLRTFRSAWEWIRLLRRKHIDLVHTFDLYTNVFAAPLARLAGVPVVLTSLRHEFVVCSRWQRWALCRAFAWSDGVLTNSAAVREGLLREGIPGSRIRVIPNGVDLKRFNPNGHSGLLRQQLCPRPDALVVGVIGNLRREKDHATLLAALPEVTRRVPQVQFLLVGTGPLEAELRRQVAASNQAAYVSFLGYRTDVPELLGAMDLVVLPTLSESLPNVVLEAMSAGRAVIASEVGGCKELVESGRTGLLVPPRDPQALAEGMIRLLEGLKLRADMGQAARQRAEEQFEIGSVVKRLEAIYEEFLERKLAAN